MQEVVGDFLLEDGEYVLVAYHLYKRCFSVRLASSRKVIGYTNRIVLSDVSFPVQAAGRLRVLKEKRKNVHAFVKGKINHSIRIPHYPQMREVYYNPYVVEVFVDRETMEPVTHVSVALCENGKVYYIK
jgi:hypothetical protein